MEYTRCTWNAVNVHRRTVGYDLVVTVGKNPAHIRTPVSHIRPRPAGSPKTAERVDRRRSERRSEPEAWAFCSPGHRVQQKNERRRQASNVVVGEASSCNLLACLTSVANEPDCILLIIWPRCTCTVYSVMP